MPVLKYYSFENTGYSGGSNALGLFDFAGDTL